MTTPPGAIQGAEAAQDAARDWQAVHGDASIQYQPLPMPKIPQIETPAWLKALDRFLRAIFEPVGKALGMSWPVMQWVLVGLAVIAVLYAIWRFSEPLRERVRGGKVAPAEN